MVAISTGKGELKGYVGNPGIGEMPLVEAVGKGTVQVVKNHPDWPRPYNGITGIRHGTFNCRDDTLIYTFRKCDIDLFFVVLHLL